MKLRSSIYRDLLDELSDGVYFLDTDRRIVYWSRGAERITGYSAEEVVGTRCAENILVHTDENGAPLCGRASCPALKVIQSGARLQKKVFLKHKRGHRVPVLTQVNPILDDAGSVVGAAEVFSLASEVEIAKSQIEELRRTSLLDPLTDVGNRRLGETELWSRLEEAERYGWQFGVLFIDVDRFKLVNDVHGHAVGDRLLKMIANTLSYNVRSSDVVIRWGGDEFLVLLKNINDADLLATTRKLRGLVESCSLDVGAFKLNATVSIGATLAQVGDTVEALLKRVDDAMYESKKGGGNRMSTDRDRLQVVGAGKSRRTLAG